MARSTARVLAVGAHPDDIEFRMAGTLILLRQAGWEVHYFNVANGSCGTTRCGRDAIVRIRRREAQAAAASIGAVWHPSLANDIEVFYTRPLLARVGALLREVNPDVVLTHSPEDYMEDHQNTARLAVTAAFCRGMPNFPTRPPRPPTARDVAVYHAQPVGNCTPLRQPVQPDLFVDTSSVLPAQRAMLACHLSQKAWLDESQGMNSYLDAMEAQAREVGALSGRFPAAEGWRRRLHFGFAPRDADPLRAALAALCCSGRRAGRGR